MHDTQVHMAAVDWTRTSRLVVSCTLTHAPSFTPAKRNTTGKIALQVDRIAQVGIPSNFESLPQHPCHLRSAEGTSSSSGAEVRGRIFRRQGQHRSGLAAYLTDRVVPERARRRLLQSVSRTFPCQQWLAMARIKESADCPHCLRHSVSCRGTV